MSERDEELLAPLLRRLRLRQPGKKLPIGCPRDESLAAYLDGGLSEPARDEIESHLAVCRSCLDHILAAENAAREVSTAVVPPKMLARAMSLMLQTKPRGDVFNLVVELVRDSLALISTSGRLVMPTMAVQIRGKEKIADNSVLHVESDLGQFQVAVEVERLEDDLCQVAVNVKSNAGSVTDGLRLSLMSGEREQASYLARQGAAVFDRIPTGEYQLVVSGSGDSIGVIQLSIKESGHERERKTD